MLERRYFRGFRVLRGVGFFGLYCRVLRFRGCSGLLVLGASGLEFLASLDSRDSSSRILGFRGAVFTP